MAPSRRPNRTCDIVYDRFSAALQQKIAELEHAHDAKLKEIVQLQAQLGDVQTKVVSDAVAATAALHSLQTEAASLRAQIALLKTQLTELQSETAASDEALCAFKVDAACDAHEFTQEIVQLREQQVKARDEASQRANTIARLKAQIGEQEAQAASAASAHTTLHDELQSVQADTARLKAELAAAQGRLIELEVENAARTVRMRTFSMKCIFTNSHDIRRS